jgi:hypothetical protein
MPQEVSKHLERHLVNEQPGHPEGARPYTRDEDDSSAASDWGAAF